MHVRPGIACGSSSGPEVGAEVGAEVVASEVAVAGTDAEEEAMATGTIARIGMR